MPNLFPYTNTHELNLDWILQVVKEMLDKYKDIDTHIADALAEIEAARSGSLTDIQTALENAMADINEAIANIGSAETSALLNISSARSDALDAISSDRQAAQTAIATDKADARSAIANDKADAQSAISTDRQAAQNAIATDKADAQSAIATDKATALEAIQVSIQAALATLTGTETQIIGRVNTLLETLPDDSQTILSQLKIMQSILNDNFSYLVGWRQGYYQGTTGQNFVINDTYLSTEMVSGTYGMKIQVSCETGFIIHEISYWTHTYSGGVIVSEERHTATLQSTTFADVQLPNNAATVVITVRKSDYSTITQPEILGNVNIIWPMNALKVPNMIAYTESTLTASVAHIVGEKSELFMYNGILYKATTDIPQYGTIVITGSGANCEETTVSEEITRWTTDFIAPTESRSTADVAREPGEYFFLDGELYVATDDIDIGDTIAEGTNCENVSVGEELNKLNNAVGIINLLFNDYKSRRSANGALISDNKSCVTNLISFKKNDIVNVSNNYVYLFTRVDGTYFANWTSGTYKIQSDSDLYIEVRNASQTSLTEEQVAEIHNSVHVDRLNPGFDAIAREQIAGLSNECFVAVNGSDENDGSKDHPFKTVNHAISAGYKNICVMDGEYTENINLSNAIGINIYAYNYMLYSAFPNTPRHRPTFTNGTKYTSFTDDGSYKHFALSNAPTRYNEVFIAQTRTPTETVNARVRNSAGLWANFANRYNDKQLKPVLSLDALSEADTFYYDGTNVYFNTDSNITSITVVGNYENMATFSTCNNLHLNGINFEYGFSRNLFVPWSNNVRIENCEFGHSIQNHNSEFTMSDVTLVNCTSYLAGLDGYNSSYYGVTRLINCNGLYNLDDGDSSHEYCEIIVEGGEYAYNGKGGHSPVHGCKFSCNGTYAHNNLYGLYLAANANYDIPDLLISNSAIIDNTTADILNVLCTTRLMNVKYNTKTVTSGSVIDLTGS